MPFFDRKPDPKQVRPGRLQAAPENFISQEEISRRMFLRKAAGTAAGTVAAAGAAAVSLPALAQEEARKGDPAILELPVHSKSAGAPVAATGYGLPSRYERNVQRRESPGLTRSSLSSVAFAPLASLFGVITPSGLHFERHHAGYHDIDPSQHRLMIHGLVSEPHVYTMDELMRFPSVTRTHFIECGANTGMEWGNVAVPTVQYTHGMLSCSEFTGVLLSTLLDDCGVDRKKARFVLAEGADGSGLTRTISFEAAMDDVMVVYGQNGEMLRPENGYPLRLVVPGVQGVSSVKWLRRIEVGDQPWNQREESLHYVDLMPNGLHRQYTWIQECKSVITAPSGGQVLLDKGYYEITGLAWSGRGKIRRVDVSVDGGRNWQTARLQEPVQSKCLTRFRVDWMWDGGPAILQSRAIDDTGYVQPRNKELRAVRGSKSIYHNNSIQSWKVTETGEVFNVQV